MQSHARAVVIGGGAVGCSILYHLAKAGWTDSLLLERDELTAGSTWHAAGLLPLFNMSYAVSHIHQRSIELYERLEEETGLNAGFYRVGNLRMAQTAERMDEYKLYAATADTVGVNYEWLTNKDIKDRYPLVHSDDLKGAIFHPDDGYINPADVTQAMAKGARMAGATIERKKQVDGIVRLPSGEWQISGHDMVTKETFEVVCDVVVTATGNHAQRTAAMVGCYIPAMPVEHQYVVTGESPTLRAWRDAGNPEHPVLRDADAKWYVREERGGWILGPYEKFAPAWAKWGVPENFYADLLEPDLERIEEELMSGMHRIPCFEEGGIKTTYNGPICYTPDGNPLVGPAPGVDNFYFAEGFSFGITAAGGTGHYLAQLITQGEAEIDMWSLDPRRFGSWMNREYAATKNEEAYDHVYVLHHPDEERPAARPLRQAPCYDRMKAAGAQFGCVNGWERPNYFAATPQFADLEFSDHDSRSFRRGDWWKFTEAEARATREGLGLFDATAFTKHIVKGAGAEAFLDWLTCNKLPKLNRINLTYALTDAGTIRTEFTILRNGPDNFYCVSAGAAQAYDHDYLVKMAASKEAEFGRIDVIDVTTQYGVFAIAGPNSRQLMQKLVSSPDPSGAFTNKAFPWLSAKKIGLGMVNVTAIRVAYVGELGWEIHHPIEMQNHLFDAIREAGADLGLTLCGARAMNWLRQEKSYRAFGSDLGRDATPLEGGLDRFVDLTKDFKGKAAMEATGIRAKCVTVLVDGPQDGAVWGREVLLRSDGTHTGRLTSGGYAVALNKLIGIGYTRPEDSVPGTKLQVKIMGELYPAEVVAESPYDPKNELMRVNG